MKNLQLKNNIFQILSDLFCVNRKLSKFISNEIDKEVYSIFNILIWINFYTYILALIIWITFVLSYENILYIQKKKDNISYNNYLKLISKYYEVSKVF